MLLLFELNRALSFLPFCPMTMMIAKEITSRQSFNSDLHDINVDSTASMLFQSPKGGCSQSTHAAVFFRLTCF